MDTKLILIKAITLLYCESICKRITKRSDELAFEVISRLKLPDKISETNVGRNAIVGLRETLLWMSEHSDEEVFDFNSLVQRVRMNADDDYATIHAFEDAEEYQDYDDDKLLKVCRSLRKELKDAINQWAIRDIIHKAHRQLFYSYKPIDWKKYVQDLVTDLESYSNGWTQDQQEFVLNLMNMSDKQSIKKVLEEARNETQGQGGFKSGWQRLNKMFGKSGLLHRGEFVIVGALTHNYKSGLVHDLFRHFCIYNDPVQTDETKKPTLLYFSTENSAREDMMRMYVALKGNTTGESIDVSQIELDEASDYVSERLTERGWEVQMQRVDPHNFTYTDLFNYVLHYESTGHEIHAIVFDYLSLINKKGCNGGVPGDDVRILMQKVRTFMSSRNILFITPHQLSQEAMGLKRSGVADFVGEVAGKNYWDASKRIANEADMEIFLDIVEHDKKSYLAICRGKHRTIRAAPKKHTKFYLPFDERFNFIPDDLESEDRSIDSLSAVGADEEIDWK